MLKQKQTDVFKITVAETVYEKLKKKRLNKQVLLNG